MKKDCYTVISVTKFISTEAIIEISVLNSFETEKQAIASLKYEEQVETLENNRTVKWNSETEIQISGFRNYDETVVIYIDNSSYYHDKSESDIIYMCQPN